MTTLVFGIDGLDYDYVSSRGLLESLDPSLLEQDLEGGNALYTYRVWPSIFASDPGGESERGYAAYNPSEPYIWDEVPASVMLVPVPKEEDGKTTKKQYNFGYQDEFPGDSWRESWTPIERLQEGLDHLETGISRAIDDEIPLVVATTRIPDMMAHHFGDEDITHEYIEKACHLAAYMCDLADDYMVMSDHGIMLDGPGGLDDHTRRAVFASSFTEYDTMSALIKGFKRDIHSKLNQKQMESLGYV